MHEFNESLSTNSTAGPPEVTTQVVTDTESPPAVSRDIDPDRSNLPRLVGMLVLLSMVAISPFLAGQVQYNLTRGRMRAEVEMSTAALNELEPRLQDFSLASRLVAKRVSPSVVSVDRADRRGVIGQGSGVIVDEAGYIITNYHVIENASELDVRLLDGRVVDATLVGADPQIDVAVLKIDASDLIAAEWGDSDELDVGDFVWALGSPFGLECTVTYGIVSAKHRRSSNGVTSSPYQEYFQTDVAINPGNSGGPLVDLKGNVVGINTMIVGETYAGVSFAVPSNLARETYESLRKNGIIERGYLGVQPFKVPHDIRTEMGLASREGVYIGVVEAPSPASRAGLRVGDVILSWNDGEADDPTLLSRAIAATPIGAEAHIRVKRLEKGEPRELELTVTVSGRPRSQRPLPN